jgi:hypothetical protein
MFAAMFLYEYKRIGEKGPLFTAVMSRLFVLVDESLEVPP